MFKRSGTELLVGCTTFMELEMHWVIGYNKL